MVLWKKLALIYMSCRLLSAWLFTNAAVVDGLSLVDVVGIDEVGEELPLGVGSELVGAIRVDHGSVDEEEGDEQSHQLQNDISHWKIRDK